MGVGRGRHRPLQVAGSIEWLVLFPDLREVARLAERENTPGEIRTPDLLIRSQALYPAELRVLSLSSGLACPKNEVYSAQRKGFRKGKLRSIGLRAKSVTTR